MKKILFLTYAALALFAVSCTKEEDLPALSPTEGKTFITVGGSRELPDNGTKSKMADNGAFSWTYSDSDENNDAILVCGFDSVFGKYSFSEIECIGYPDEEEKINARFSGWVTGEVQNYAVFPATLGASFTGSYLTLNLPSEITWKEGEANNLMVAPTRTFANGVHNFAFYNVAGLFKVTLNGLPSTARKVSFYAAKSFAEETPKKITGSFSINMSAVNVEGTEKVYPQITTENATTDDFVTIKWSDEPASSMVFYVPVPTGEYSGFSFRVKDAEDNVLASFKGKTAKTVTRGKLIILPALTLTTAGGGGDNGGSKLVVPHNYTANNGVFVLPETSSDIELDIESNNEVTIAYSSENADKKPANVYMTVLGDVNSLTINLPDSHVELSGQVVDNTNHTITNLTSNTSVSTLVINETVKIGKEGAENSGLTIKGGSLNLDAPVTGAVTIDIPNVNTTEEKVNISIKSKITDLKVTKAATQTLPDKIFVTLENGSKVANEINVPEVNCNLYIAPGAEAKTVETSATSNTIEGTVETLTAQPKEGTSESTVNVTVTGTVDNLAATGEGTTVVIEEGAEVSTSISSTDNAVVVVVVDENTDEVATVPDNQSQSGGGQIIESQGQVAAKIGDKTYESLEDAWNAVKDGETITLLADCEGNGLIAPQEKFATTGITVNFGGYTYTVKGNLVGSTGTESQAFQLLKDNKITFINGTITSEKAKILVQNYSNLTLKGMTLSLKNANYQYAYTLSNNNGEIFIDGSTINVNSAGGFAFDVCRYATYRSVSVTVKGQSVINGDIEVSASNNDALDGFNLNLTSGTINGALVLDNSAKKAMNNNPSKALIIKADEVSLDVPEGYLWVDNNDNTSTLRPFVAQIGETKYGSLASALANVPDATETTITMLANEVINVGVSPLTIGANKNVVLELNGNVITGFCESGSASALITNNGTLKIQDNTDVNKNGSGDGKIYAGANPAWIYEGGNDYSGSYASNLITNRGNLTIESGYYESTTSGNAAYVIDNYTNGVVVINGGHMYNYHTNAIRLFCNSATADNSVTINGGVIEGYCTIWVQGASGSTERGNLTITGGTFKTTEKAVVNGSKTIAEGNSYIYMWPSNANMSVNISGGEFYTNVCCWGNGSESISGGTFYGEVYNATQKGFITAGTFHEDLDSSYIASGYAATQSGNVYIVGPAPVADYVFEDDVVTVYTAAGLSYVSLHYADFRDSEHNLSIKLAADLNMTGKEFSSFDVNNYTSSDKEIKLFTFDGQNHTLSGMTGMLISKSWAGHSAMDVKNLTIAYSTIEQDVDDLDPVNHPVGVGAICGTAEASQYLRITNVHLINSTVRGGHWTGGLVGNAAGYDNPNNGPVLEKIYVTDCSVEGCVIEGKGSNGALVGHAAMNPATLWEVKNFRVLNNSINNTGGKTDRTGALIGTLGWINEASSAFPEEKNKIWFTSPLVVTGNSVLGVANDAKKVGRLGTAGSPVYLDNVNVIANWL